MIHHPGAEPSLENRYQDQTLHRRIWTEQREVLNKTETFSIFQPTGPDKASHWHPSLCIVFTLLCNFRGRQENVEILAPCNVGKVSAPLPHHYSTPYHCPAIVVRATRQTPGKPVISSDQNLSFRSGEEEAIFQFILPGYFPIVLLWECRLLHGCQILYIWNIRGEAQGRDF